MGRSTRIKKSLGQLITEARPLFTHPKSTDLIQIVKSKETTSGSMAANKTKKITPNQEVIIAAKALFRIEEDYGIETLNSVIQRLQKEVNSPTNRQ